MSNPIDLIQLARDNSSDARAKLASNTASQLLNRSDDLSANELRLFDEVFSHLYQFAPPDIRKQLASTLALAEWAPKNILRDLANDDFSVAGPVISFSPVLDDETLIQVITAKGEQHQSCVAERGNIGEGVTAALIDTEATSVVATLSKNKTATINASDFARAVEIVKNNPSAIDNFASRTDLPPSLVAKVFDLASPEAKARMKKKQQKLAAKSETTGTTNASKPEIRSDISNQNQENQLSSSQIFALLVSNQKSMFIKAASTNLGISPDKLLNLLSTDLTQNYAFMARALGFERKAVNILSTAFGSGLEHISPTEEKIIALTWIKYIPTTAKVHIQTITANM